MHTNTATMVAPPSLWSHGHSHEKIEIAHNLLYEPEISAQFPNGDTLALLHIQTTEQQEAKIRESNKKYTLVTHTTEDPIL